MCEILIVGILFEWLCSPSRSSSAKLHDHVYILLDVKFVNSIFYVVYCSLSNGLVCAVLCELCLIYVFMRVMILVISDVWYISNDIQFLSLNVFFIITYIDISIIIVPCIYNTLDVLKGDFDWHMF